MMQSFWINFFKTFLVDKHLRRLENVPPFGGVPEWPKGSDCKSDAKASVVRIHPPPPSGLSRKAKDRKLKVRKAKREGLPSLGTVSKVGE